MYNQKCKKTGWKIDGKTIGKSGVKTVGKSGRRIDGKTGKRITVRIRLRKIGERGFLII